MRLCIATLILFLGFKYASGTTSPTDSAGIYFDEIKAVTSKHKGLWNRDLYGPILLVNPDTREVFANSPDSLGILAKREGWFTGTLPANVNIANTSLHWSGRNWAMIILPLPKDRFERLNLMAHELFHMSQSALGFTSYNPDNGHLDQKEGRVYLRLELNALAKAIMASAKKEIATHIKNAILFREYRHYIFPQSDSLENTLELNEGLAEYTGLMLSGRNKEQVQKYFSEGMEKFLRNPTFVRSFAYQTIPLYGYLLSNSRPNWNKEISSQSNLTDYFIKTFGIKVPVNLKEEAMRQANYYNGYVIEKEEASRKEKKDLQKAQYINEFVTGPHFNIHLEKMNISFDPRNIVPLDNYGTVYPNLRITDNWGILNVEKGALLSSSWNEVTVTNPLRIDSNKLAGDGWELQLNPDYELRRDDSTGNYSLLKK